MQATFLQPIKIMTFILILYIGINYHFKNVLQRDQTNLLQIWVLDVIKAAIRWIFITSFNLCDDCQVSASLLEAREDLQARGRVIDMHDLSQHIRELFDGDFVAIRAEQDQVFRHEYTYDISPLPLVDWYSAVALRVDFLRDLTIYHSVDIQAEDVVDGDHDLTDRNIAQLESRSEYLTLLVLNHLHLLLNLEEFLHFSLGHHDTDFFAQYFVQYRGDWISENESYDNSDP